MTENKVDTSHELLNQTGLVQGCGAGGHDHKDYGEDQDYPDIPDEDQMFTFPEVDAELPSLEADYYDDFYNAENDGLPWVDIRKLEWENDWPKASEERFDPNQGRRNR